MQSKPTGRPLTRGKPTLVGRTKTIGETFPTHISTKLNKRTPQSRPESIASGEDQHFVVKRPSIAARSEDDLNQAMQILADGDSDAIAEMINDGKVAAFGIGTRLYPVKSANFLGTMWLVRSKGSSQVWWVSVKAFMAAD